MLTGPLFMKDELSGLLVVGSGHPLCRARTSDTLEALIVAGGARAGQRRPHRGPAPPAERGAVPSLVQNSTDVVMVVDVDSTIRYMSPSVEASSDTRPRSSRARKLTELIHPEDKARVLQFLTTGAVAKATIRHAADRVPHASPRRLLAPRRDAPHQPDARREREGDRAELAGRLGAEGVRGAARASGVPRLDHRPREPGAVP